MRHSERGTFNSCPYKYYLESAGLRKIETALQDEDRTFGQAIHAGLKCHYDGLGWPEIEKAYSDLYPDGRVYKSQAKSFEAGILLLKAYRAYWSEQDKLWDIMGTEVEGKVLFNDEEHGLHIDLIAKNKQTEEIWVWDHKTTEKNLGKGFWGKFELDSQVTRYTKYIKDKYGSCGGFIINALVTGHRKRAYMGEPAGYWQKFERQPFSRTLAQIKFWEESEKDWQATIKFAEETTTWPKHLGSLCSYCTFYEYCMSGGSENIKETLYTYEPIGDDRSLAFNVIDETK